MFKPKYTITNKILNNLTAIAEIRALVGRAAILPKQEIRLRRQALIRMIHSSTSIEGNILARYEVEKALTGERIDAPKRDIYEIKNYRITVVDSLVTIYRNGSKIISFVSEQYPQGKIALKITNESTIDDFKVREILE